MLTIVGNIKDFLNTDVNEIIKHEHGIKRRFLILASVLGLVLFIITSATFSFQSGLFNFLYSKPSSQAQEIDQITNLTNQLLQSDREYDQSVEKSAISATSSAQPTPPNDQQILLNKMIDLAKQRKELLLQTLQTNPQAFLDKATLVDKRDIFPDEVKQYIEQRVEKEGKLEVIHADYFDQQKSEYKYYLKEELDDKSIKRYELHFIKDPSKVLTDSQVRVKGVALDERIALESNDSPTDQYTLEVITAASTITIGEQKTVILMVNFDDNPDFKPFTKSHIEDLVFSNSNPKSVNTFYKETSFNKAYFNGDVFGWYSVTFDPRCDYHLWSNQAREKAIVGGVNLNIYTRIVYAFSSTYGCSLADGYASVGGNPTESWIFINPGFARTQGVYVHEIGHNLGNLHANTIFCGAKAIDEYRLCAQYEYGDSYDVMGGNIINFNQFNAPHKIAMGWIPEANIKTATENGVYTLVPLESSASAVQVLLVPKPDTSEFYYVSYRQKIGFDSSLPDSITNGASIHIWVPPNPLYWTKFIDTKPETRDNFIDATLSDGSFFYDQINYIFIKQISHTPSTPLNVGSVSIEVKTGGVTPRRVFVTSTDYNGNLGGLAGADEKCQERANFADLGGTWEAWLSNGTTSATSRISHSDINVPFVLIDGKKIADNWNDLTVGSLINMINITELNQTRNQTVWTNSKSSGEVDHIDKHCNNWNSSQNSDFGSYGISYSRNEFWTSQGIRECNNTNALYCFEEIIPPPQVFYSLTPSWNSIGIPINISINLSELLSKTAGKCTSLVGVNPSTQKLSSYPNNGATEETLTSIDSGYGYLIYCNDNASFTLTGSDLTDYVKMYSGNQIVSVPQSKNNILAEDFLQEIVTKEPTLSCPAVAKYDKTTNDWNTIHYIGTFENNFQMRSNEGYLLYCQSR